MICQSQSFKFHVDPKPSHSIHRWLFPILLVGIVFLVFHPVLHNGFLNWDDQTEIYQNPDLNPASVDGMLWNWSHTRMTLYMPVTYSAWGLVAAAASRDSNGVLLPFAFHLFSLLLHSACCVLVFTLLRKLHAPPLAAFAGSLLFAVHPIQTEAIAWASGMYTLLSTALGLLAMHLFLTSWEVPKSSRIYYATATLIFILALLTKAASAAVPLMLIAIELIILRRGIRIVIEHAASWIVLSIPIIILAKHFQDISTVPVPPPWARPVVAADSFAFYFCKIFWPVRFIPDYGRNPHWVMNHLSSAIPFAALGATLLIFAVFASRKWTWASCGILVFIAAVLPYSGLTTFDFQYVSTVADRYAYLGLIGVAIAVAAVAWKKRLIQIGIFLTCGVLSILSWQQTKIWQNTDTLFFHTLSLNPDSLIAESVLGYEAKQQGRPTEARARYEHAVQIWPDDSAIHFGLGNLDLDQNPLAAAVEYRIAIRIQPKSAIYHNSLAEALRRTGDLHGAFDEFSQAIQCDPSYADAHTNLGNMLLSAGQIDRAEQEFQTALSLKPDSPAALRGLQRVRNGMNAGK